MKKTLLTLTVVISACLFAFGQETITINARLKNLQKGDTVYLMRKIPKRIIDTLVCVKKGQINTSLTLDITQDGALFYIPKGKKMTDLKSKDILTFCLYGGQINIKGDVLSLPSATVTGTVYDNAKYAMYFEGLKAILEKATPLRARLNSLLEQGKKMRNDKTIPIEQKSELDKKIRATNDSTWAVVGESYQYMAQWIKANPNDMFSVYVLTSRRTSKELKELYEALSPELKISPNGLYISKSLKIEKSFQEGKEKLVAGSDFTDFTLTEINGKKLTLSSIRGKYVVLDFWGSWCGPCREANKHMVTLYNKYKDRKDFDMVSMALDKDDKAWREAVKKDSLVWHQVNMCEEKDELKAINVIHGIYMYPTQVLLSPEGKILAIQLGENEKNDLVAKKLKEIMGE